MSLPFSLDLEALPQEQLLGLAEAAREVALCERVLAKTGDNVVAELLRGSDQFFEWQHYPPNDIYDPEFHAQFYYHAHPEAERPSGEHGHFHTFMRPLGMPEGVKPAAVPDLRIEREPDDALSHLVGISMDRLGRAYRLFTTNRWVTGETWYAAGDVVRMLDGFVVDHARPSWPLNRWITSLIRLYRPEIEWLLRERDATLTRFSDARAGWNVFEDRSIEVLSELPIDVADRIDTIEATLRRQRRLERRARKVG